MKRLETRIRRAERKVNGEFTEAQRAVLEAWADITLPESPIPVFNEDTKEDDSTHEYRLPHGASYRDELEIRSKG